MIFKLLVLDKEGSIGKRVEDMFTRFMRDYQVYRTASLEETIASGKQECVDVIIINGDDYPDLTPENLQDFKRKIIPSPKLLLLLEPNLLNTLPALENEAHRVLDSTNFRMLRIRNVVHDLIRDRFLEDYARRKAEAKRKKDELESLLADVRDIKEELGQKNRGGE